MERGHLKILLIEDDRQLATLFMRSLTEAGYQVGWASNGAQGLEIALREEYAVVLLDWMLPGKTGWDILLQLRAKRPSLPILMMSGMDDVEHKVQALRFGADDYLVKPFELAEMVARIEALLRRDQRSRDLVTRVSDLVLDRKTRRVTRRGHEIPLNRREYDLLEALASNEGVAVDRETLQRRVWTDDEAFDKSVDVFVRTLKEKVDEPFHSNLIHTSGKGVYMLGEEEDCLDCPPLPELVA